MSATTKKRNKVGDIKRLDYQSDIYRQQYRLLERLDSKGHGTLWRIEYLEDDEETFAKMIEDAENENEKYWTYNDVLDRIDGYGRVSEIRLVSREAWDRMF